MILQVKDLTVRFGGLVAVNKLSFEVEPCTIHGLIGPNGAGKTTVFNSIFKLVPYNGNLIYKNIDLGKCPTHSLVNMGISRTFQNLSIFFSMTVKENILVGLHSKKSSNLFKDALGFPIDSEKELSEVCELLNILPYLNVYAMFLPYGVLKMVELARALISKPELILLDEPGSGLNPAEKERLKEIIKRIKEMRVSVLMVEHDMGIIMDISDEITVMNFGEKISAGTPEVVSHDQKVIEAYLGEENYA